MLVKLEKNMMLNSLSYYIKSPKRFLLGLIKHSRILIPDKIYICWQYKLSNGVKLHLHNPQTFTEKIQWLKLYNRKPEYSRMVDKYEVKKHVASIIGDEYIIPTYGAWNRFDDIDFEKLPEQFILKSTHGSHAAIICSNKNKFDKNKAKKLFEKYQKKSPYVDFGEWAYKDVKPRIIAEKFMQNGNDKELTDFKFFCFNGEVKYCQVIKNRSVDETIDFFDIKWKHQEFVGLNPLASNSSNEIMPPQNYDEMLRIATKLSQNIPFVRIDLYEINGKVYFGEITFYPGGGLGFFTPLHWNKILGDMITLPIDKLH